MPTKQRLKSPPRHSGSSKRLQLQSAKPGKVRDHLMHNLQTPQNLQLLRPDGVAEKHMVFAEAGRKLREMQK